jgi:hypothetical protein
MEVDEAAGELKAFSDLLARRKQAVRLRRNDVVHAQDELRRPRLAVKKTHLRSW